MQWKLLLFCGELHGWSHSDSYTAVLFFFFFSSRPLFQELWAITAPRPGTNSSSEASTSGKGSGRLSPKTSAACLGGWDEGGTARGNARKYGESIQTAIKRRLQNPNLGPSCNEVTATPPPPHPSTLFHIYCLFTPVIKATFAVNYEFHYCIETCLVFFFTFCFFEFSPSLWPRQHFSHVPVGGACLEKAELSQSAQSTELWGKWRVVRGWSLRLIIRCFYDELLTFPSDLNKRGKDWGFLQAPVGRPHCCSGHCSNQ